MCKAKFLKLKEVQTNLANTKSLELPAGGIIALLLGDSDAATSAAGPELYEGLGLLQHRGQDACGIVTCGPKGRFYQMKGNGMVRDVLDPSAIGSLVGSMGIGHGAPIYPVAIMQARKLS
jgi:amidophosphoribosyltransferase